MRHFAKWYARVYVEPFTIGALSTDAVTRYRAFCQSRVRAGTFNRRRAALNHLACHALDQGLIDGNPVAGVPCAKVIPQQQYHSIGVGRGHWERRWV